MKGGWQKLTLANVCEIRPPKSEARESLDSNSLVSFVPMAKLGIDRKYPIVNEEKKISEVIGSYTYFADGDVLLAKITPCFENGKLGIANGLKNRVGFGSSEFIVFRPSNKLDKEYLYYFLSRPEFREEGASLMGGAVGQQRVPKEFIENYLIPVPSLSKQKRIVDILNDALVGIETAKANTEKNIKNARTLFSSHVKSVFTRRGEGWVEKRLDEVCEIIMGQSPEGKTYNTAGKGMPLINGPVEFSSEPFGKTVRTKFTTQPTKLCKENDLILCVRGSTTGKMNIAGFEACVGRGVAVIRAKEYQPWINHFINANRERIYNLGTGATFPNVSGLMIGNLMLSFPSIKDQRHLSARLDSLLLETQHLESIYMQKLVELDDLKKSLLNQAFAGEL